MQFLVNYQHEEFAIQSLNHTVSGDTQERVMQAAYRGRINRRWYPSQIKTTTGVLVWTEAGGWTKEGEELFSKRKK